MEERARVGEVELAFGIDGSGPRLVWFHGLASCRDGDRDLIDALAQRFTVLSFDARGHGRSEPVTDPSRYSYALLAEDAVALLGHLGWERAILAGSSMGAATAARIAMLSDVARSLVVVRPAAGGADGAAPSWLQMLFAGGAHAIRSGGLDAAIDFLRAIPEAREQLDRDPARIEQLRVDWQRHDPASIAAALEGLPRTSPLAGGLSGAMISCPVLVIPGDDVIHPRAAAEEVATSIPGAILDEPFGAIARADEVAALVERITGFVARDVAAR